MKQEEEIKFKEMCGRCSKPFARTGAMSGWIFAGQSCCCTGVLEERHQTAKSNLAGNFESGTIIDQVYRVIDVIGQGGMSQVYRCENLVNGDIVALKVMRRDMPMGEEMSERFRQEAHLLLSLSHLHIVKAFDYAETAEGDCYIVMEMLSGTPLSTIISKSFRLPIFRLSKIADQIFEALEAAHDLGVVHRDLKPSNVMIVRSEDKEDYVKLLDFGIAKLYSQDTQQLTTAGEIFGSPSYMSPEQARGRKVDARSDQYSLACVLFEALAGRPPFAEGNSFQIAIAQAEQLPPKLIDVVRQSIPSSMSIAIDRMLKKDPAERYATIGEARNAFFGRTKPVKSLNKKLLACCSVGLLLIIGTFLMLPEFRGTASRADNQEKRESSPEHPVTQEALLQQQAEAGQVSSNPDFDRMNNFFKTVTRTTASIDGTWRYAQKEGSKTVDSGIMKISYLALEDREVLLGFASGQSSTKGILGIYETGKGPVTVGDTTSQTRWRAEFPPSGTNDVSFSPISPNGFSAVRTDAQFNSSNFVSSPLYRQIVGPWEWVQLPADELSKNFSFERVHDSDSGLMAFQYKEPNRRATWIMVLDQAGRAICGRGVKLFNRAIEKHDGVLGFYADGKLLAVRRP